MSEINQTRWDQLLRRIADLKGPGSKVNDALSELFPVIEVENVPSELLLPMGTRMCMGRTNLGAGGAGNFQHHFLHNPVGSGMLATILMIAEKTTAAMSVAFGPTQNVGTITGTRAITDLRAFPEQPTCVTMADNNLLVAGVNFFQLFDNALGLLWTPPRGLAVLNPGGSFMVSSGSTNLPQTTSWFWIERAAQESELNF